MILFDNNFMPNSWREILKVDRSRDSIVVTFDHRVPAPTQQAAAAQVDRARVRQEVRHQAISRRRLQPGHQPPARRRLRLRAAGHGAAVQRFAYLQRAACSTASRAASAGRTSSTRRSRARPGSASAKPCATSCTASCRAAVTAKDAFLQIAGAHGDHATHERRIRRPGRRGTVDQRAQDADDDVGRAVGGVRDLRSRRGC